MNLVWQQLSAYYSSLDSEGLLEDALLGFRCFSIPTQEEREDEQPEWPNGAGRPGGYLGSCYELAPAP
ncbi:hypothetical protein [Adhaeribacter aerolatus]|uniref:hypothetical protein n=1 Tax=Adhaeribacter aerolatus TaxID=670289 RepID=UPI0011BF5554|nr:hypothetical protein [Adhaeribacter aerolatus]